MEAVQALTGVNKRLGMKLFIISDALTFAALLAVYCYLRLSSDNWPRPFSWSSIGYATLMSVCLFTSSLTMVAAVRTARRGARRLTVRWILATIAGGIAFLLLHLNEWKRLVDEGLTLRTVPKEWGSASLAFGSTFFGITGLHMLHVFSGVILLGVVAARPKATTTEIEISGMYWQFVDAVWVFVFVLIYLFSRS